MTDTAQRSRLLIPAPLSFELPGELEAGEPPEARGLTRDAVRMMVATQRGGTLEHTTFSELPSHLDDGDVVVVNTSGTLAAHVSAIGPGGRRVDVHLSTRLPADLWSVELRSGGQALLTAAAGESYTLTGGARLVLLAPYARHPGGVRLWVATLDLPETLPAYLARYGSPIRYGYVRGDWPISMYQNVYATEPGSAEMPSAGRPFSAEVVLRLAAKGVGIVPVLLHTGVASLESSEPPYPEFFRVGEASARRINDARHHGARVVAIGTTVVRTLETVVDSSGEISPGSGWTETIITPDRNVRSVDGLLTGWHEPEASHLAMLEAVGGRELLERSYAAALAEGYLWHEFGDVHLILP